MPDETLVREGRAILDRVAADCGLYRRPPIYVNPHFAATLRAAGFTEGVDFVETENLPVNVTGTR